MNRDQSIIKTIQKTIEIASGKIEKTIKLDTVQAAQKQTGLRPARPPFLGPEARQPTAGPPNRPTATSPPPPAWAASQPRRRGAISTVDLDRTVARAFRRIKTRRRRDVPQTLGHSPLPFLSPRDAAATRASMAAGEKRGRRRRRPPRRRACSARAGAPPSSGLAAVPRTLARALVPPASRTASGCLLCCAPLARAALIRPAQVRPWVMHRPSKSGVPFPLGLGLGFHC